MIKILYKDKYIVVCEKPVNILSEEQTNTKRTMPEILKKMTGAYKVDTVHRLDKMVGGCMVYSLSRRATEVLSKAVRDRKIIKEYLAVVHGAPESPEGVFEDFLFKDSKNNKSYVVKTLRKGAKDAKLSYRLISTKEYDGAPISLVKIRLHTGRTHQIRVQFSHRKMPLVGDTKYGSREKEVNIALWSHHLEFCHPTQKGKTVSEYSLPALSQYPWKLFREEIAKLNEGNVQNEL